MPPGQKLVCLRDVHLAGKDVVGRAQAAQFVGARPKAGCQARQVGRAQRGGLEVLRAVKLASQKVCLELHEEVVGAGAAVHVKNAQLAARVCGHGVTQVADLVSQGLKSCAGNVGAPGAARQAIDCAAGLAVPPGGAQAGEGRHNIDAAGVGDAQCQGLGLGRSANNAQLIAQPLDQCASHKDRALKRIDQPVVRRRARGHGGHQVVRAGAGLVAGVQQHKAAGAVGVFGLARLKTALAKQSRLLVAGNARDRNARGDPGVARLAKETRAGAHLGHHRGRDTKEVQQLLVPAAAVDVKQHRAACVGGVGRVHQAAGQDPDKPGVHGAKQKLTGLGALAGAGDVAQDPADLAGREVGVGEKTGLGTDLLGNLGRAAQLFYQIGAAAALPHDGVHHGGAGGGVPHNGGLALVVDTNRVDVLGGQPALGNKLGQAP